MIYKLKGKTPEISGDIGFLAPSADIIGDVKLAEGVSVWFNAVIRGDVDSISIGKNSNIQDSCVVHVDEGVPCTLGEGVTVGHSVVLHGCTIGNNCLIGMNATVLNGAVIGDNCLIGANSLVSQGMKIPPLSLVVGSPAKVLKELKPSMIEAIRKNGIHYVERSGIYQDELAGLEELSE